MTDYSTSKYENAEAEEADAIVLDGFTDDSIYDGEMVAFDLVTLDTGRKVILSRDSQGFVWIEYSGEIRGDPNIAPHWAMLRAEWADRCPDCGDIVDATIACKCFADTDDPR